MTDVQIEIIKIKEILKKMQEDIKKIENSIPFYPTTYQYSPEIDTVYTTQACSEEELLKSFREQKINWVDKPEWDEVNKTLLINNN